ncbi:hypothetical protein [Chitinibacter sp. GC72]|uniref:hypothetical protein n=1 Tax=Chitinibacter sp. GC72 TaxID=1526917 RepID=UPI0012F96779|nr:hypothetical protein [Chitinibacter sp. GC72]
MFENLKNFASIAFGGLLIGTLARRLHESIKNIPAIVDTATIETESIYLGTMTSILIIWMILTLLAIEKHKPWKESKDFFKKFYPNEKVCWIRVALRAHVTFVCYVWYYFPVALFFCFAMAGGFNSGFAYLATWWFGLFFMNLLFIRLNNTDSEPLPGETFANNISEMFGVSNDKIKFIFPTLLTSFGIAIGAFNYISPIIGGGKPQTLTIKLKKDEEITFSNGKSIDGQKIVIVYRKGSKLIAKDDTKNGAYLVFDIDSVNHIYALSN